MLLLKFLPYKNYETLLWSAKANTNLQAVQSNPDLAWSKFRHQFREPLSEFFGVFILILFGDGVVAQVVLSGGTKGDYQSISWGWGYVNSIYSRLTN